MNYTEVTAIRSCNSRGKQVLEHFTECTTHWLTCGLTDLWSDNDKFMY